MNQSTPAPEFELRRRAEALVEDGGSPLADLAPEEAGRLIHELKVYQAELEIQNEELRRSQDELAASRNRFSLLFQEAPVGYLVLDHRGAIAECNLTYCNLVEIPLGGLLGSAFADQLAEPDRKTFLSRFRAILKNPAGKRMEARLGPASGRRITVRIDFAPMPARLAEGPGTGPLLLTLTDITDQKDAESKIRESEERFRVIFQTSPDALSINRLRDGLYIDVNDRFCTLTGYAREAVLGQTFLGLGLFESREVRRSLLDSLHRSGSLHNLEVPIRCADGGLKHTLISARVMSIGHTPHVVSITRDITSLKQAEVERARLESRLLQAQKMEAVGRLAGGVAHDFNNMLSLILGRAELAADGLDPSHPAFQDLEEIQKAAHRSAELTRQLLAFARKQTVTPRVLDLNEAVSATLLMLRRLIVEDINLIWAPGPRLWPVKIDPTQVDQILTNLCLNARDAIRGGGRITIRTENITLDTMSEGAQRWSVLPGDYVRLSVQDDGSGMGPDVIEHLFEPFFTTKNLGKGTGLGLATIYGIVQQNRGGIEVESTPSEGSTFHIYLPRYAGSPAGGGDPAAATPLRSGRETVLLVEDEPMILEMGKTMLEKLGYRVLTTTSPREAVRIAGEQSGRIDVLLTDVVMPEMNGKDLARQLVSRYPFIKCVFTSGYTADVIAQHGVLDEGVHFIAKPFSRLELARKLREVLD